MVDQITTDYISRKAAIEAAKKSHLYFDLKPIIKSIPAADVRPVVTCADCKYNNACLTQAFVEEASRVPFDRSAFFCADGKRADDA